ncbi:MAG: hypothetical protein EOP56_05660 [Sphingobacteriales bacterium]|nr:MAG: hypothetical protein EOP56_05660 [Sphingobacteriales bacterium]
MAGHLCAWLAGVSYLHFGFSSWRICTVTVCCTPVS